MKSGMSDSTFESSLLAELSSLIEQTKSIVVSQANYALTLLFWKIGKRVNEAVLQNQRGDYGKRIVVTLARHLTEKYGRNFEEKICAVCSNLQNNFRMMKLSLHCHDN